LVNCSGWKIASTEEDNGPIHVPDGDKDHKFCGDDIINAIK
jgi:hypothetical protein